ncbi:TPA: hypothetical protein N2A72_003477 [Pseudomonas aeruginosa]|nr:hypothetical protein [Pseudomonas aeruginosa]
MNKANECTCPSGDGSLVHPCPAHPAVEQVGGDERASKPGLFCRDCGSRLMVRGVCSIYCPNCVKAQVKQAEAERPEVFGLERYRVEKTGQGFWPYCVRAGDGTRELFAGHLKQCKRVAAQLATAFEDGKFVAGALRAEIAEWQEAAGRSRSDVVAYIAERAKLLEERDAALVEVERLRESKGDPVGSLEKCMKVMYERDEHAKRLEAALARVAELEKELAMARDAASKGDAARHAACGMEMEIQELKAKLADPTAVHQWQFSNAWFDGSEEAVLKAGKEGSPIRTLYTAPAQAQHSVPEVSGIGRDFAYPRSVVLYLRTEPTDDDLRAIHDGLRSLAAAPGKEGNDD